MRAHPPAVCVDINCCGRETMTGERGVIAALLILLVAPAWAADLYFGGYGDTNWHWTGYSVEQSNMVLTNWVAYTLSRPGKIAKAPATFHRISTNGWSAIFDEYLF